MPVAEKVTKEKVLVCAKETRILLKTIWYRKHRWLGHVLRYDNFLHEIIAGNENVGQGYSGLQNGRSYCTFDGREKDLIGDRSRWRQYSK